MSPLSSDTAWPRLDRPLYSIQYLRAVSALLVLSIHAMQRLGVTDMRSENFMPVLSGALSSSMDLFFLMSGFLCMTITDQHSRPWEFAKDRLGRIVPLYWLITLVCAWLLWSGILNFPEISPRSLFANMRDADWAFVAASLLFVPVRGPFETDLNPIIPQGWTLNFEMGFYLLFTLGLYLPRRLMVPVLTVLFFAVFLLGAAIAGPPAYEFWTSPLILEFIAGLWIGSTWQRGWPMWRTLLLLLLAWVPVMAVTFNFVAEGPFQPLRIAFAPMVIAILCITLMFERRPGGIGKTEPLKTIGDASYSIYLWHFIPIILLDVAGKSLTIGAWTYFVLLMVIGTGGGVLIHFAIEKPIMRYMRRRRGSGRWFDDRKQAALGSSAVLGAQP